MEPEVHQPVYYPKGWGRELWVANNELYCQKYLIVHKGKRCSIHYHKLKDETFHILSGHLQLDLYGEISDLDDLAHYTDSTRTRLVLNPGDVIRIKPLTPHQFYGLTDCAFTEISTQHFETDSYRVQRGDTLEGHIEHSPQPFDVNL